jgi:hypothetical protein
MKCNLFVVNGISVLLVVGHELKKMAETAAFC